MLFFSWLVDDLQIGSFEHNLTTDLLNHLVFLQKVFMKEVNEVIQKVSGTNAINALIDPADTTRLLSASHTSIQTKLNHN